VKAKLELDYEYLGEQQVKNIAEPVRAYRVRMDDPESASPQAPAQEADKPSRLPAIAVLPLANMSNDPEQEYFSDGITEDLITNLSKFSRLFVTARNTVFTYKGKAVNVQQVGKELDVAYVLEGSVRKAGNRVRITAQLIDVSTGNHVWAERYDRELHDIFEVQDEITHHIVEALDVGLLDGEQARVWRQSTQSAEAYDYFLQGRHRWQSTRTRQGMIQARQLYEQAVALDGNFARALAALATLCSFEAKYGWSQSPQASLSQGFELVNRAIVLDNSLAYAWGILALLRLENKEHDQALRDAERGVSLNPDGADINSFLAMSQFFVGKPKQALATSRKAVALAPTPTPLQLYTLGLHCFWSGSLEEARAALKKALEGAPDYLDAHVILAAVHAAQEGEREAKGEEQEVLRIEPDFKLKEWVPRLFPFKNEEDSERMMDLLRKASLPE
jgi:adenylate cyclase